MRFLAVLVSVAFLAGALPQTGAQAPPPDADTTFTGGDPASDVAFQAGTRAGLPTQNASQIGGTTFDHLDLLKLFFGEETDDSFQIGLYLKAYDQGQATTGGFPYRFLGFTYGKLDWRIVLGPCDRRQQSPVTTQGCLQYKDPSRTQFRGVKTLAAEKRDGGFLFTLSKLDVFNEARVPAQFGQALTGLYASATQYYATTGFLPTGDPTGGVTAFDRAPDGGFFKSAFLFSKGSGGRGALGLTSSDPIRVSNGEATTIVYDTSIHNTGDQDLKVQMTSKEARPEWTVRVPDLLEVPAKSSVKFPVILALPFTHDHGKTVTFKVEAQAIEDPGSMAEIQLGIFWTDIPQPSAHHNGEEWFHSAPADLQGFAAAEAAFPFMQYWMNGIEMDPDPDATDADVPAFFNDYFFCLFAAPGSAPNPASCQVPPKFSASWFFPLAPELLIGLDFDLAGEGNMIMDIMSSLPATQGVVTVGLVYCDPTAGTRGGPGSFSNGTCTSYSTVLAKGSVSSAMAAKSNNHFEVPLKVEAIADLIPYKRGANVGIAINLVTDLPQNMIITEPRPLFVTKKARLFLPLIEYHDPIDQAFEEVGLVQLSSNDPFEKFVNPGKTTVFHLDLYNKDDIEHHFSLEVQGINADWASLVGEKIVALGPGKRMNVSLAVTAPGDAVDEERAELFIVAQSQEESWVVALTRLRATVTTAQEIPDEAASVVVQEKKGTPGVGVALVLLAACAALAVVSRRRRFDD